MFECEHVLTACQQPAVTLALYRDDKPAHAIQQSKK